MVPSDTPAVGVANSAEDLVWHTCSHGQTKCEHANITTRRENEKYCSWRCNNGALSLYLESHISQLCYRNKATRQFGLHGKKSRYLSVLVHIFVMAFHLPMTAQLPLQWVEAALQNCCSTPECRGCMSLFTVLISFHR